MVHGSSSNHVRHGRRRSRQRTSSQGGPRFSGPDPKPDAPTVIGPVNLTPSWGARSRPPCKLSPSSDSSIRAVLQSTLPPTRSQAVEEGAALPPGTGLHTWGDLTHLDEEGRRHWLPAFVLIPLASSPEELCHPGLQHPYRPGQLWILRGTSAQHGGMFEICAAPHSTDGGGHPGEVDRDGDAAKPCMHPSPWADPHSLWAPHHTYNCQPPIFAHEAINAS